MAGRGAHAEFWDDEVELLAAGLLSLAVRKLLLARSTKGELEAWMRQQGDTGAQMDVKIKKQC